MAVQTYDDCPVLLNKILALKHPNGSGCIAVNDKDTFLAISSTYHNCVSLFSVGHEFVLRHQFGTPPPGMDHGRTGLHHPRFICFADRDGVDTLLIADDANGRIVEIGITGTFIRAIRIPGSGHSFAGILYANGTIIVSYDGCVEARHYDSGKRKKGGWWSFLTNVRGGTLRRSADKQHALLINDGIIMKLRLHDGEHELHGVAVTGICNDVLELEDGGRLIVCEDNTYFTCRDGHVVPRFINKDTAPGYNPCTGTSDRDSDDECTRMVKKRRRDFYDNYEWTTRERCSCGLQCVVTTTNRFGDNDARSLAECTYSCAYSKTHGMLLKTSKGVWRLSAPWATSLRCAWVSANF